MAGQYKKFKDIPQFPRAHYECHRAWANLHEDIEKDQREELAPFVMVPDYQRGHVWSEEQQIAFVEYGLMGGENSMVITTNCPGWMVDWRGPYELVDGLQRVTAVLRFVRGEIPAFGRRIGEYEDKLRSTSGPHFRWRVCNLPTRAEVLRLYLLMNAGGVVHSAKEIECVRRLLAQEEKK